MSTTTPTPGVLRPSDYGEVSRRFDALLTALAQHEPDAAQVLTLPITELLLLSDYPSAAQLPRAARNASRVLARFECALRGAGLSVQPSRRAPIVPLLDSATG